MKRQSKKCIFTNGSVCYAPKKIAIDNDSVKSITHTNTTKIKCYMRADKNNRRIKRLFYCHFCRDDKCHETELKSLIYNDDERRLRKAVKRHCIYYTIKDSIKDMD